MATGRCRGAPSIFSTFDELRRPTDDTLDVDDDSDDLVHYSRKNEKPRSGSVELPLHSQHVRTHVSTRGLLYTALLLVATALCWSGMLPTTLWGRRYGRPREVYEGNITCEEERRQLKRSPMTSLLATPPDLSAAYAVTLDVDVGELQDVPDTPPAHTASAHINEMLDGLMMANTAARPPPAIASSSPLLAPPSPSPTPAAPPSQTLSPTSPTAAFTSHQNPPPQRSLQQQLLMMIPSASSTSMLAVLVVAVLVVAVLVVAVLLLPPLRQLWYHRRMCPIVRRRLLRGGGRSTCVVVLEPARSTRQPQQSRDASIKMPPTLGAVLGAEHPYYEIIDHAAQKVCVHPNDARSEARMRARSFRSHHPCRWRIAPAKFAPPRSPSPRQGGRFAANDGASDGFSGDEETDEGAQAFDFPLYDWGVAEAKMDDLERKHAYTIQRPPLAYADDLACLGAQQSGCDWYFSTADFDTAIVYGRMELKATAGDARVKIALTRGGE